MGKRRPRASGPPGPSQLPRASLLVTGPPLSPSGAPAAMFTDLAPIPWSLATGVGARPLPSESGWGTKGPLAGGWVCALQW